MSVDMDALTRQVTVCFVSGWHAWAKQSDAVRVKHNRGTMDGIEYWDCPFCASTHCRDVGVTRIGRARQIRADADTDLDEEAPLSPMVPETWTACVECRTPCASDFCNAECRAEWTARWVASPHACDEQAMAAAS